MIRASRRTERCLIADIFALSYTFSTTEAPFSLSQVAEYTTQSLQQAAADSRAGRRVSLAFHCVLMYSRHHLEG
jgi:hypothetical protein